MGNAATRKGRKTTGEPMSLRFPSELRKRVKRYAQSRGLEEATAVRTLCADRLNELEVREDLESAERWQLEQALADMDRLERGELRTVGLDEVRTAFTVARKRLTR